MTSISEFLTGDHRECDEQLAAAEQAVDGGNWDTGRQLTETFLAAMEHHFTMEEQVLFPAFEQQTGITMGPTAIMREEHAQMRGLLTQLRDAMERGDRNDYLETTETLLFMMQQHNMKEEGMLYPMCDQRLADTGELVGSMQRMTR